MLSIYTAQLVQPAAAPLVMRMRGYIRGVATVRIYPYHAIRDKFHKFQILLAYLAGLDPKCCVKSYPKGPNYSKRDVQPFFLEVGFVPNRMDNF